jgi:hypothetical protein
MIYMAEEFGYASAISFFSDTRFVPGLKTTWNANAKIMYWYVFVCFEKWPKSELEVLIRETSNIERRTSKNNS